MHLFAFLPSVTVFDEVTQESRNTTHRTFKKPVVKCVCACVCGCRLSSGQTLVSMETYWARITKSAGHWHTVHISVSLSACLLLTTFTCSPVRWRITAVSITCLQFVFFRLSQMISTIYTLPGLWWPRWCLYFFWSSLTGHGEEFKLTFDLFGVRCSSCTEGCCSCIETMTVAVVTKTTIIIQMLDVQWAWQIVLHKLHVNIVMTVAVAYRARQSWFVEEHRSSPCWRNWLKIVSGSSCTI